MQDEERLRQIFKRNLFYLIAQSGQPMQKIADATGISKGALSNYCSGYRYPRPSQLEALANYFHVTVGELTDDGQSDELSQRAYQVAKSFDKLSEASKQLVEVVIRNELERITEG